MLHLWYGADSFSRNEALAVLRADLDVDGMLETNTSRFDGRTVAPDELFAACDTVPFLAAARLVIVEGLLAASSEGRQRRGRSGRAARGRAGPEARASWDALVEYVPRLPPSSHLLLLEGGLRPDHPLLVALRPLAELREFRPLDREALQRWITARVRSRGAAITPKAVAVLAESAGSGLWQLAGEVEKLTLYAADRPIDVADVRALVSVAPTGTIFELVDAVMAGRGDDALRLTRKLLEEGAAGPYLLTMIARQFRQFLLLSDMQRRGLPRQEMALRLELRSDYVLGRLLEQARRYPARRLEEGFARLLATDLDVKRGVQEEDAAVELLVAELAGAR